MKKGKPAKKTQDFRDKFDALAVKYCDPLERLFVFAQNADGKYGFDVASKACAELVQYRYAKLKNVEVALDAQLSGGIVCSWMPESPTGHAGTKKRPTKSKAKPATESKSGTGAQGKQSEQ